MEENPLRPKDRFVWRNVRWDNARLWMTLQVEIKSSVVFIFRSDITSTAFQLILFTASILLIVSVKE